MASALNETKQYAKVFIPGIDGGIGLYVAPAGDIEHALIGALKKQRIPVTPEKYLAIVGDDRTRIEWGDVVPTRKLLDRFKKRYLTHQEAMHEAAIERGTLPDPKFSPCKICDSMTQVGVACHVCGSDNYDNISTHDLLART